MPAHQLPVAQHASGRLTRGNRRIHRVHVEAQMYRLVKAWVDVLQRHLHDFADTISVDLVHRERLDPVLLQDLLLRRVDVSQTDIYAMRQLEHIPLAAPLTGLLA